MADNESFWSAEFQFNASSAVTAKNIINSFVDSLGRAVEAGSATEKQAEKTARLLLDVGLAAGKAVGGVDRYASAAGRAARAAAQMRLAISGNGFRNNGFETGLLKNIQGVDSVNSAVARAKQKAQSEADDAAALAKAQADAAASAARTKAAGLAEGTYHTDSLASTDAINAEAKARSDASAQLKTYMQAKYAAIAAENREIATLNGTAAAIERNIRAQKSLASSVAAASRRNEDTGRFQVANTSTYSGQGLLPSIKTLPGLSNAVALATQKYEALTEAEGKATAAAKTAADAQAKVTAQLRTAASAGATLRTSIANGTNNFASGGLLQAIPQIQALKSATEGLVLPMSQVSAHAEELQGVMGNFYPLIVAAGVFGTLSTAMLGFDGTVIKTAADYQTAFAQVSRTTVSEGGNTEAAIANVRQGLLDLSTAIPVGFQDLSGIATLGNQLGVQADQILSFSKTVAEFSTVTGVTNEQTAKSFGALGQILKLTSEDYNKFGSSITFVGRNSVATEAEIVTLTERLGATAANAGFTAEQIVGLSGALASLREAPERSQGAFEIFFKQINNAAALGGDKLENFAKLIGKTTDETQNLIKTSPYEFFQEFLGALSKLDHADQTVALGKLGLSGIRVSEVMQRLANNLDLVNKIQKDAETGYSDGTDLSDQYAQATDTLNAQFQELVNSVNNFFAALGNSGALSVLTVLVSTAKDFVTAVTGIAQGYPILSSFVVGLSAVAGAFFLVRTASIATQIAVMALGDARIAALGGSGLLSGAKALVTLLIGEGAAARTAAASNAELAASSAGAAAGQRALAGASTTSTAAISGSAVALRAFKFALAGTGIGLAVVALGALAEAFMNTSTASDSLNKDTIAAALRKDQAEYEKTGTKIRMIGTEQQKSTTASASWVAGLEKATGAQVTLNDRTTTTTSAIDKQSVAYGTNAKAAIASALANDQAFQKLFSGGALDKLNSNGSGFNSQTYIKRLLGNPEDAVAYIDQYQQTIQSRLTRLGAAKLGGTQIAQDLRDQSDALGVLKDYASNADGALQQAANSNAALGAVSQATGIDLQSLASGMDESTDSALTASDGAQTLTEQYAGLISQTFGAINAQYAQQQALYDVGTAFVEQGAAAAFSGQSIQDYINNVIATSPTASAAADTLQAFANSIVTAGFAANASAPELANLNAVIAGLGGSQVKTSSTLVNFRAGMQKAYSSASKASSGISGVGTASEKAAKKVRTLADYASDLGGVFDRSFELRFGASEANDAIAQQFQDMKDSAADAAKAIQDAKDKIKSIRAEIAGLKADNQQQAYFLSVAQAFGDNLRAGSIQAQIDSNNADIASKKTDLSDANKDKSKAEADSNNTTNGTSEAARNNRKALKDLVDKYKDYIQKLAESGLNQKELNKKVAEAKERFKDQAASLGFNRKQITPYVSALGDIKQVIDKIPRNITVRANADPALQALNEFEAKAKAAAEGAKKALGGSSGKGITVPALNVEGGSINGAIKMALKAQIAYLTRVIANETDNYQKTSNAANRDIANLAALKKQLQGYSDGGYTGSGGKYEPAGVVHKGEYVIPKHYVNQSTGLPYADALGRLVRGAQGRQHYAGGGFVNPGMGVTELGPVSLRVLREAVHTEVKAVISAEKTANAVNSVNSNRRRRGGDGG